MLFEPKSTRKPPFRRGRHYRVRTTFTPPYDDGTFNAGDVLEYRYTAYDGTDGYFFVQHGPARRWRRWDISTCDDLEVWTTLFELPPRHRAWWRRRILVLLAVALAAGLAWQRLPTRIPAHTPPPLQNQQPGR